MGKGTVHWPCGYAREGSRRINACCDDCGPGSNHGDGAFQVTLNGNGVAVLEMSAPPARQKTLTLSLRVGDGRACLSVRGELDGLGREDFVRAAIEALQSGETLELDLSALEFLDTVGVSGLVAASNIARADGKAITITSCSAQARHILHLSGLSGLLAT